MEFVKKNKRVCHVYSENKYRIQVLKIAFWFGNTYLYVRIVVLFLVSRHTQLCIVTVTMDGTCQHSTLHLQKEIIVYSPVFIRYSSTFIRHHRLPQNQFLFTLPNRSIFRTAGMIQHRLYVPVTASRHTNVITSRRRRKNIFQKTFFQGIHKLFFVNCLSEKFPTVPRRLAAIDVSPCLFPINDFGIDLMLHKDAVTAVTRRLPHSHRLELPRSSVLTVVNIDCSPDDVMVP